VKLAILPGAIEPILSSCRQNRRLDRHRAERVVDADALLGTATRPDGVSRLTPNDASASGAAGPIGRSSDRRAGWPAGARKPRAPSHRRAVPEAHFAVFVGEADGVIGIGADDRAERAMRPTCSSVELAKWTITVRWSARGFLGHQFLDDIEERLEARSR